MNDGVIQAALYAIAERNAGRLTPDLVLLSAQSPDSPLHEHFTWDDTDAARKHRLNEARTLIRSVKVEITTTHFTMSAPVFIRDPEAGRSQGYVSTGTLRTDRDLAREAVIAEFS